MASRTLGEVMQILQLMGHAPRSPAFLAARGRPLPEQVSLWQIYLAFGQRMALYQADGRDTSQGALRLFQRGVPNSDWTPSHSFHTLHALESLDSHFSSTMVWVDGWTSRFPPRHLSRHC